MDKQIFIDTGAFLALFHKNDQLHQQSNKIWMLMKNNNNILITTNHIIDELATLLARRTSYDFASRKLQEIYNSDYPIIMRPDHDDEKEALKLFSKFADQRVSFTDCLSFAIIKRLNIKEVFSFDRHFVYAGFNVISY